MTHLEVLCNLTNQTLERELADEELRRLLVPTDFTESDGTGPEAMGLLHATSRGLNAQCQTPQQNMPTRIRWR